MPYKKNDDGTYALDEYGNFQKTVYCGWCYTTGHNARSCPERYPEGTPAQRRNREKEEAKAAAKASGVKTPRKCSYCEERGHIRRVCPQLTTDKARLVDEVVQYRTETSKWVKERGIGPGALIAHVDEEWDYTQNKYVKHNLYQVVQSFDFGHMDPHFHYYIALRDDYDWHKVQPMRMVRVSGTPAEMGRDHRAPMLTKDGEVESVLHECMQTLGQGTEKEGREVICPGKVNVPDDYLDRASIEESIEGYFKTLKTRRHYNVMQRLDVIDKSEE